MERSKSLLTNVPNPQKRCLPPLVDREGNLVWSADEKAFLFSAHFDAKQCRDSFQQSHFCDPFLVLCSVAFRFSFIRSCFLDLDPYGRNDPDCMFSFFYKQITRELTPKLAVIFRHLVKRLVFRHAEG